MIETERLLMREFELADAEQVLVFATNDQVNKYTGDPNVIQDLNGAKNLIQNIWQADYKNYGYGRWALIDKESERVIGFCGLKYLTDLKKTDLGYRMLPEFWGRGYATEAGAATLKYGYEKLGLTEIIGLTLDGNIASDKVLLKLGFVESEDSPIETLGEIAKLFIHVRD